MISAGKNWPRFLHFFLNGEHSFSHNHSTICACVHVRAAFCDYYLVSDVISECDYRIINISWFGEKPKECLMDVLFVRGI